MSFGYPGNQNTFIPTQELSGNLMIGFGRNVKDFAVNRIIKLTTVTKTIGYYQYFNPLDLARFASGVTDQYDWPPGTPRPSGSYNTQGFEYRPFQTRRKAYPCDLDELAVAQATFPVLKINTESTAQLAMTDRAWEVASLVTTSANYPATHVDTAAHWSAAIYDGSASGGFLSAGTATAPYIKRAFNNLALKINKDTAGSVRARGLKVVMNPNTAIALSQTQEVHSIFTNSVFAQKLLTGEKSSINAQWGLPDDLYSYEVVVEDTTINLYNRDASGEAITYVFPDNYIAMIAREGDFEQPEGATTKSTVSLFVYGPDDMKVESFPDPVNRLTRMSVVDNRQALMTAGVTGGLITNVFS